MATAAWLSTALVSTLLIWAAQADGGDRDSQIYHSPSTLSQDLKAMMERFRVFIYPELNSSRSCDLRKLGSTAALENLFIAKLAASNFITHDPEEADLFVLPISVSCISNNKNKRGSKVGNGLRRYIQELRDSFPYWHRALGADHVFISCKGFNPDASRNVLELKKNAIQIGCFPMAPGEDLFPHKDITMPPLPSTQLGLDSRRRRRSILAYYSSLAVEIPSAVKQSWEEDPSIASGALDVDSLSSSSFCISSGRSDRAFIVEALRHGCIPVVFADQQSRLQDLPLQDILDWRRFSLVLASSDMGRLGGILRGIDEEEMERMRDGGRLAAKRMEWNDVPKPLDAFYMVMYQLWGRHYATRYVDQ